MDPNSTFKLKIKLLGNRKKCRKYMKCFSFDMVVDSDKMNYEDLVELVVEKYLSGYLEVAHIQYYDEGLKSFLEVKTDQELMSMFDKHLKRKVVIIFVVYRGHSDPYEPVTEWDFGVDTQPKDNIDNDNIDNDDVDEDDYLRNPELQSEHVGVNEETMYCDIVAPNALQVVRSLIKKTHPMLLVIMRMIVKVEMSHGMRKRCHAMRKTMLQM